MQRFLNLSMRQRIIIAVVVQAVITGVIGLWVYLSCSSVMNKLDLQGKNRRRQHGHPGDAAGRKEFYII